MIVQVRIRTQWRYLYNVTLLTDSPFLLFTFASPVDAYESAQQITTSLRSLRLCLEAASVDAAEADAAKEDPATAAASPTAAKVYCLLPIAHAYHFS